MIYNAMSNSSGENAWNLLHQSDDIIPPASNCVVLCFVLLTCPNKNPQQHMDLSAFHYIIGFTFIWQDPYKLVVTFPSSICHGREASGLISLQPWKSPSLYNIFIIISTCTLYVYLNHTVRGSSGFESCNEIKIFSKFHCLTKQLKQHRGKVLRVERV